MSSPPPLLLPPSPPAPPAPPASMPLHGYPNMLPGHMQTATHLHSPQPAPAYEPPGQYVDGHMLRGNGWSLISPTEHATVHFVGNGVRPCDYPYGYYPLQFPFSKHKVSCDMTVRELIKGLGCPPGPLHGITELILRGNDWFAAGDSFTQGGEASTKTLREVGWTCQRGEGKEVWLVVKKGGD